MRRLVGPVGGNAAVGGRAPSCAGGGGGAALTLCSLWHGVTLAPGCLA